MVVKASRPVELRVKGKLVADLTRKNAIQKG